MLLHSPSSNPASFLTCCIYEFLSSDRCNGCFSVLILPSKSHCILLYTPTLPLHGVQRIRSPLTKVLNFHLERLNALLPFLNGPIPGMNQRLPQFIRLELLLEEAEGSFRFLDNTL